MGNNSSQAYSDTEEGPEYRYHEAVLREAQSRSPPMQPNGPMDCLSDDDQFYSADEGGSSRSITPERTRPESSSGEEQMSEDDQEVGVQSAILMSPPPVSPQRAKLRAKRSCGQCNVSVYQEHDSIGPELEAANGINGHWASPTRLGRIPPRPGNKICTSPTSNQSPPKKAKLDTSLSPFQPIHHPVRQLRLTKDQLLSASLAKRKLQAGEDDASVSPAKQALIRDSSKRKRLGHFDSSDPETDASSDEEAARTSQKRSKLSRSKKKQSRPDRRSSESDSGEDRYGKMRKHGDRDSEESDDHAARRSLRKRRATNEGGGKKGKTRSLAEESDTNYSPGEDQRGSPQSNFYSKDHISPTRKARPKGNESERVSSEIPENELPTDNVLQEAENSHRSSTSGAAQSARANNTCPKMGDQGIRNVHGKVLPLRQQGLSILPQSHTNKSGETFTPHSDSITPSLLQRQGHMSNITRRLRPHFSSAFHALQLQASPPQPASQSQDSSKTGSTGGGMTPLETVSPREEHSSPFKDVVLTPPSLTSSPLKASTPQNMQSSQNSDSSNKDLDNPSPIPLRDQGHNIRPITRAKRRQEGRTAAERFRNFWTSKKTNIQTFLSKTLKSPSKPPRADGVNTPSETVDPSQGRSINCARGTLGSPSSPVTFLSSDGRVGIPSTPPSQSPSHAQWSCPQPSSVSSAGTSPSHIAPRGGPWQPSPGAFADDPSQARSRTSPRLRSCDTSSSNSLVEILPRISQFQVLHVRLAKCLTVSVSLGEVADATTAGLVNWTDNELSHTLTSCSRVVAARAGALLRAGCTDYLENKGGPLEAPDVLTTPAGGKFHPSVEAVLHVVAPPVGHASATSLLLQVYTNCLRFAEERLGLETLTFPLVGQDMFPMDTCVQCFHDSLILFLAERQQQQQQQQREEGLRSPTSNHSTTTASTTSTGSLVGVHLVIPDAMTTDFTADHLQSCLAQLSSCGDLATAAAKTTDHYWGLGPGQHKRDQDQDKPSPAAGDKHSLSPTPAALNMGDGGRPASGRPRVKRPRL